VLGQVEDLLAGLDMVRPQREQPVNNQPSDRPFWDSEPGPGYLEARRRGASEYFVALNGDIDSAGKHFGPN
jgi:hypothetical protein